MKVSASDVKCGHCGVLVEPAPHDSYRCPKCRQIATADDVIREVGRYLYDVGVIGPSLKKKPREKREHRFVVDAN